MLPFDKPTAELNEGDVRRLVDARVREGRQLEYKRELPGQGDSEKREFLADVTSFANAAGGFIVYGIEEQGGEAVDVPGISVTDADAETQRLDSLLRHGVEPRIAGVDIRPIPLSDGKFVFVIRVPRSWAAPHAVTLGGALRFFSRNSSGKYPMDMVELRTAFVAAEMTAERIRRFRAERLGLITTGEGQEPIARGVPIAVLHLVPWNAFVPTHTYDIQASLRRISPRNLAPVGALGYDERFNFDGYLTYRRTLDGKQVDYCQLFRNGAIEAVRAGWVTEHYGRKGIPSTSLAEGLIAALGRYFQVQQAFEVQPPVWVMLSLLRCRGLVLWVSLTDSPDEHTIDRDELIMPEVQVDDLNADPSAVLRPVFDILWQAAGFSRCFLYNDRGEWVPTS